MIKISERKIYKIRNLLLTGKFSDDEISKKCDVSKQTISRIHRVLILDLGKTIPIQGFNKKTAYYQDVITKDGFIMAAEMQMLSCPFYNPTELKEWERETFKNKQLSK